MTEEPEEEVFELYGNIKRQERLDAEIREKKEKQREYSKCRYCKKKLLIIPGKKRYVICKRCLRIVNKQMF